MHFLIFLLMAHLKHLTKISLCLLVQYELHLWSLKLSFRSWPDKPYLILVSVLYHGCSNSCTLAGWFLDVQLLAMVYIVHFLLVCFNYNAFLFPQRIDQFCCYFLSI